MHLLSCSSHSTKVSLVLGKPTTFAEALYVFVGDSRVFLLSYWNAISHMVSAVSVVSGVILTCVLSLFLDQSPMMIYHDYHDTADS